MKKTIFISILLVLVFFYSVIILHATNVTNDKRNFIGDRITFPVEISLTAKNNKKYCLPAGTSLKCLSNVDTNDGLWVKLNDKCGGAIGFITLGMKTCKDKIEVCKSCDSSDNIIPYDVALKMEKKYLDSYTFDRYGFTYGALVVPYKYHFKGSKNFEGNSSVGPYFGWRLGKASWFGVELKFVGFVGASAIKVTQNIDGSDVEQTLAALSFGGGLLGQIKESFQIGLILGEDIVSKDANYEDNEKLWGAISIGFSFSE